VEAVGIEPASDRLVSHDSMAITQNGFDTKTLINPSESHLTGQLGTRVPNFASIDDLSERVRRLWGVLRVV
jgi:hypothetical protein